MVSFAYSSLPPVGRLKKMPAAGLSQPKPKRFNPHHQPKKSKPKDKKESNRLGIVAKDK